MRFNIRVVIKHVHLKAVLIHGVIWHMEVTVWECCCKGPDGQGAFGLCIHLSDQFSYVISQGRLSTNSTSLFGWKVGVILALLKSITEFSQDIVYSPFRHPKQLANILDSSMWDFASLIVCSKLYLGNDGPFVDCLEIRKFLLNSKQMFLNSKKVSYKSEFANSEFANQF